MGQPGGDNGDVITRVDNAQNVDQWFWIYYAASIDHKKTSIHVRYSNGQVFNEQKDVWHFVPKSFFVYTGRDKYYHGWNGELKGMKFSVGPDVYREGDYDALMNEPITD